MNTIKEQIEAIDKNRLEIIKRLEIEIEPLAGAVTDILRKAGREKGIFRKRRSYHSSSGRLSIHQEKLFTRDDIEVFYDGVRVFTFDDNLWFAVKHHQKGVHLFFFKSGEWEEEVVNEYRRLVGLELITDYDMTGEECANYHHDAGACGRYEGRECVCEDFEEVR